MGRGPWSSQLLTSTIVNYVVVSRLGIHTPRLRLCWRSWSSSHLCSSGIVKAWWRPRSRVAHSRGSLPPGALLMAASTRKLPGQSRRPTS